VIYPPYATAQKAGPDGSKNVYERISQLAHKILPGYLTSNLQQIIFLQNKNMQI
jgi:hypothetical protein